MAIRMRRGSWEDFEPGALVSGELAVVTDGDLLTQKGLYVCYGKGDVERLLSDGSAGSLISEARAEIAEEAEEALSQLRADMEAADSGVRSDMAAADEKLGKRISSVDEYCKGEVERLDQFYGYCLKRIVDLEKASVASRAMVRALFEGKEGESR